MLNFKNLIFSFTTLLFSTINAHAVDEVDVGLIDDNAPYSDFDVWKRAEGMLPGLIDLLTNPDRIIFKYKPIDNLENLIKSLKEHKFNVAFPPQFSTPPDGILVSDPLYIQTWKLITRKSYLGFRHGRSIDLNNKRIYVLRNSPAVEIIKKTWPTVSFEEGISINEALKLLNTGAVDGIVIDSSLADMLANNFFPDHLIKVDIPYINTELSLWLAPDQNELLSTINKRIAEIQPSTISSMATRSLFSSLSFDSNKENFTENTFINAWVLVCSLSSLFLIVFLTSEKFHRRRAERDLLDSLTYWQTLLNSVPTPLLVCNLTGKITHCNHKLLTTLSLNNEDVIGSTFEQLTKQNFIDPVIDHSDWLKTISTLESQFSDRKLHIHSSENVCDITLWMAVYKDSRNIPQGILIGWFDISERKRLENELVVTTNKALCASNEKSDFLARMSHEIRSPMNAVLGILELELQKQQHPDSVLNVAYSASRQLLNIIGDVLDLSKIEAGEMQLQNHNCNLTSLLTQTIKTYSVLAAKKGLRLESDFQSIYKKHYSLDSTKLTQILSNLLSNAIKYTDKGWIKIQVLCETIDSSHDVLTFRIEDTGMGIVHDMQEKILNPYVQVDPNSPASTGLGLTICTKLLRLMNSSLHIVSAPDKGSCFSFTLRQERVNEKLNITIDRKLVCENPLEILVVDDQPANLVVMKLQLEKLGHNVTTCDDGKKAEYLLAQKSFNILLTDCQMPVMTGYELASRQRLSEQQTGNYQIIIGCTANAFSNERKKCLEAGMDDVLIKPITLHDLSKVLSEQRTSIVKLEEIYALTSKQPHLVNSIILQLQQSSEEERNRILDLVNKKTEDADMYKAIIHRQKGSFALAGFVSGVEHCEFIEQALEVNDVSNLPLFCLQLNRFISRFIFLLEQQRITWSSSFDN